MNLEKYPVIINENYNMYLFYSEGPRGRITKGVMYSQLGENLFNLSFGDWNEQKQELDDFSISNNGDRDKVLTTVASTILNFIRKYPDAQIFATGSTSVRTRLYQMGIANNFLEISVLFMIEGLIDGKWELFRRSRNYEAFLIRQK